MSARGLRAAAITLARRSGLAGAARLAGGRGRVAVLLYHHADGRALTQHLEYLLPRFDVLPVTDLVLSSERPRCRRPAVAITFDDGYRDNYTEAFPVLMRYRVPATFFVVSGFAGTIHRFWWDRLNRMMQQSRLQSLEFAGVRYSLVQRTERARLRAAIGMRLKRLSPAEIDRTLDSLAGRLEVHVPETALPGEAAGPDALMTWDEIREIHAAGYAVGSHTESHAILSRIDPAQLDRELEGSRDTIERMLGSRPALLAYPNGQPADIGGEVVAATRRAGYAGALSTVPGRWHAGVDRFMLPRVAVDADEAVDRLALRVSGFRRSPLR